MTYQPIVPTAGLTGWSFLQRTGQAQMRVFQNATEIQRDTDYFAANIAKVTSAEQLVSDRRLLRVALGAFGLQDDIDNRFFIRKILDDGTLSEEALSNRLADERYKEFSAAFGFGDFDTPNTQMSDFAENIIEKFRTRAFETAVGNQDEDLRLAMNLERELGVIAARSDSDDTMWYKVLGQPPLRAAFETALGLPNTFSQLDLDKQIEILREKTTNLTGNRDISQFSDPSTRETLVRHFLLRSQLASQAQYSSGQVALGLLQSINLGQP